MMPPMGPPGGPPPGGGGGGGLDILAQAMGQGGSSAAKQELTRLATELSVVQSRLVMENIAAAAKVSTAVRDIEAAVKLLDQGPQAGPPPALGGPGMGAPMGPPMGMMPSGPGMMG